MDALNKMTANLRATIETEKEGAAQLEKILDAEREGRFLGIDNPVDFNKEYWKRVSKRKDLSATLINRFTPKQLEIDWDSVDEPEKLAAALPLGWVAPSAAHWEAMVANGLRNALGQYQAGPYPRCSCPCGRRGWALRCEHLYQWHWSIFAGCE